MATLMQRVSAAAVLLVASCLSGCGSSATSGDGGGGAGDDPAKAAFDAVDEASLKGFLDDLTGRQGFSERWSPPAKAKFRSYWRQKMESLGATTAELTFPIKDLVGETEGHNVEAVLPGASADSLVILIHYDTVGIRHHEKENPGVDDDGSGLAMMTEAARIFSAVPDRKFTVRFAAADYEEISDLKGDYAYADYLQQKAKDEGFKILAVSDDDQTGWSCWSEDRCPKHSPAKNTTFEVIACSGDKHHYDYPDLAQGMVDIAKRYHSPLKPTVMCDGSGDTDHYPFWVAGVPAYVIEEWGSDRNPHYDDTGHDTFAHIDLDYLTNISRIQIAHQAELAGVGKR